LPYHQEEIVFEPTEKDKTYSENFKKQNKIKDSDNILGINFGSGGRWPSKSWSIEKLKELVKKLRGKYRVLLLGGPDEKEKMPKIITEMKKEGIEILANNPENSLREFAAVLNLCEKIITTDSMALHLAAALKKPTIALFFSTPPWEIEDYGRIKKISSALLEKNFFSMKASEELANSISVDEVLKNLK